MPPFDANPFLEPNVSTRPLDVPEAGGQNVRKQLEALYSGRGGGRRRHGSVLGPILFLVMAAVVIAAVVVVQYGSLGALGQAISSIF